MSISEIAISSTIQIILIALFIWGYANKDKVIKWETTYLINPLTRLIRNTLRRNEKFMNWLNAEKKHGKPDAMFRVGQIKVYGDAWK